MRAVFGYLLMYDSRALGPVPAGTVGVPSLPSLKPFATKCEAGGTSSRGFADIHSLLNQMQGMEYGIIWLTRATGRKPADTTGIALLKMF